MPGAELLGRAGLGAVLVAALGCGPAPPPAVLAPEAPVGPLGGEYRVLLPPSSAGEGPFPLVLFLHDYFGGSGVLWREGVAAELSRRMEAGEVPPFVLVAPEGDRGFWSDFHDGSRLYETWLHERLPAELARRFPVGGPNAPRAVVGISMGGLGALKLALRHPDAYPVVGSLSGLAVPLRWDVVESSNPFVRRSLKRVFGAAPDDNDLDRNDPVALLRTGAGRGGPRLLLQAGAEDEYRLDEAAEKFAGLARELGYPVELVVEPGEHDWDYWRTAVPDVVAWVVRALQETSP